MTCIIGVEHNGTVYMGADSIAVDNWAKDIFAMSKLFHKGEFLFGNCGNPRQQQLLQYLLEIPERKADINDEAYLVEVVDVVRQLFRDKGLGETDKGKDTGACFMIGYRGKLYTVEHEYQLFRSKRGFDAMGVGRDFAMGAMMAIYSAYEDWREADPETCLRKALAVSEMLSIGVAGPFVVEKLEAKPKSDDGLGNFEDFAKAFYES